MLGNVVDQKKRGTRRRKSNCASNKSKSQNESNTYRKITEKRKSELNNEVNTSHKITEYFPVRRSNRRTAKQIEEDKLVEIKNLIRTGLGEKFLEIYTCETKGRGIRAGKCYEKNEFVVEYRGEIISLKEAKIREENYSKNTKIGSYMYFFRHKGNSYCVDATKESPYKGRLINHSVLRPNLKTKVVDFGPNDTFHLILVAKRNIDEGEELLYDYGDRTPCTVANNPWLLNS